MHDSLLDQISVTKADTLILPLVKRFFRDQGMRAQAAKADEIFIASLATGTTATSQTIIGALRLCPLGEHWLLRSMSIAQPYQRRGIGLFMLQQIQPVLAAKHCYCFPYSHLQSFYLQAGFQLADSSRCPPEIKRLFEQYLDAGKAICLMQFRQG